MTASVTVRNARPEDLETLAAFNQAMALETEGRSLPDAVIREGVRNLLADPARGLYFVAEVSGEVAGQTMITQEWSDWRNGFFWWIQSVYVKPQCRRKGVFRALHTHVREAARGRGDVCGLRLYVHHDNARAMETYRRLGMRATQYALFEEDWS